MSGPPIVQDGNKLIVFGSQLIGVVIVIAGLLNQHAELRSPRPPGTQVSALPDASGNRFARLWEDPLEDVRTFEAAAQPTPTPSLLAETSPAPSVPAKTSATPADIPAEGPDDEAAILTTRARPVQQNQARPLEVMPTPSASPAPAPAGATSAIPRPTVKYLFLWNILDARPIPDETERRLRIRYAVVSAVEAVGYLPYRESVLVPINLDTKGDATNPASKKRLIGYFETFSAPPNDATFKFQRVCLIWTPKQYEIKDSIIKTVTDQIGELDENVIPDSDLHFVHYGTSDDFASFLQRQKDFPSASKYSFMYATMPIKFSSPTPPPSLRPIVTDNVLVSRLADELKLRIPALNLDSSHRTEQSGQQNPAPSFPRIVIFTESNTRYSRAMAAELKSQLPNTRQEVYTYLRGLDGRPNNGRSAAPSDNAQQNASPEIQSRGISETSFGTSQFDYLRRTALRLEGRKSRDRENRVIAVGILGSDIYDKMLVLQAVRPELPSAIFFTTDLDALYLQQEMEPFTRNLVVASAADLNANGTKPGWKLPPMRDSYQSVLVKEVRNLLTSPDPNANFTPPARQSRIYEIAPGKNIELDPNNQSTAALKTWAGLLHLLASWWLNPIIFGAALANAMLILWAIFNRLLKKTNGRALMKQRAAKAIIVFEIAVTSLFVFFLLYKLSWSHAQLLLGEPLGLGVSIWPSVMIRLLAFIVAILLLLIAARSFLIYGAEEKDKLKESLSDTTTLPALLDDLISPEARMRRVYIFSVLYLLFSFVLFGIWPPTVPGRGPWPLLIEKIVLAFGVSLYIIHLIFCIDLHWSALRLLRAVATFYAPGAQQTLASAGNAPAVLAALGILTNVIGRTLLYPLTVLILIILSRLRLFDNWRMTPSLTVTFALGAILLVAASLVLWVEGARLKRLLLLHAKNRSRTTEELQEINVGVFAAWYNQPIFSALLSAGAVFGSLTVAGPIARLLFS